MLDFRFSDPPRSTMALKRAMDMPSPARCWRCSPRCSLVISLLILLDSGRAGPLPPAPRRQGRQAVHDAEVPHDGRPTPRSGWASWSTSRSSTSRRFKIPDDPRVTRAGRLLRRTSLDELPQLINVLRGDMSLVGPRPEEEAVVALYDERQRARLAVKPGLTGPMQVYGRGDLTFEERLAMERDYLDNLSVAGDLAILLRTPRAIVRGDGAY